MQPPRQCRGSSYLNTQNPGPVIHPYDPGLQQRCFGRRHFVNFSQQTDETVTLLVVLEQELLTIEKDALLRLDDVSLSTSQSLAMVF